MPTKLRISKLIALLILSSLYGCASAPPCARQAPISKELQQAAPPPEMFSRCLREILAYGRGELDQISAGCSSFLQAAAIK